MTLIEELYLGWQPLTHTVGCKTPTWDTVEVLHDDGARPMQTGAEPHACSNDTCSHNPTFDRVRLRLLCKDCGTVYTITGEGLTQACTHTSLTGWGQPPRTLNGLRLWPGQPAAPGHYPHDYLVTSGDADQPTTSNLLGLIARYRDADHSPRWLAGAGINPEGEHQVHSLRWDHRAAGLHDLTDAVDWIAATRTQQQRPVVVSVG